MSKAIDTLNRIAEECNADENFMGYVYEANRVDKIIDEAVKEIEVMEALIKKLEAPKTCDGCKYFKLDNEFNDGYGQCFLGIHKPNYETSYHEGYSFCCSMHEPKDNA